MAQAASRSIERTVTAHQLQPLLLLCTGTLVVIANQVVSNQGAVSAKAQMLTLMRYLFTCGLSAILVQRERRSKPGPPAPPTAGPQGSMAVAEPLTPKQKRRLLLLLLCVGLLDVGCYSLYNLGFAMCGSALATIVLAAMGQVGTALLSVTLLKRQLHLRHVVAVSIVTIGLVLRSMDDILAGSFTSKPGSMQSKQMYGVLLVMLSAVLFSILGVLYEMRGADRKVTQAQASCAVSGTSLAITLVHQLLYCLPNWQQLVAVPFAASGLSIRSVMLTHAVYGLITAGHQYVQLRLLASHGAMTVGLVNAVRASAVSVISSWLFCHIKSELCLSTWRGISALVVTFGAVQWVFAGKPSTRQQVGKKEA